MLQYPKICIVNVLIAYPNFGAMIIQGDLMPHCARNLCRSPALCPLPRYYSVPIAVFGLRVCLVTSWRMLDHGRDGWWSETSVTEIGRGLNVQVLSTERQ